MNETEDYRPSPADEPGAEDPRLVKALREYQAALEAGARPNQRQFLERHPDIAGELAECLDGLEFLNAAAPRLQAAPGPAPAATPVPADGTLGDFHLMREIGRGGMGVVYEAVQISLGRRVALKVLPFAATLDARQLQRFENEARAAAQLHHSNIVPVFAVGVDRGVHYYAMQLIDGVTLAGAIDHLRQAPKPAAPAAETVAGAASLTHQSVASKAFFRTVATIGVQAAEALDYAHQMGVVHRDVKPGNLILDGRGNLWVTDFGLARVQSSPTVTASGDLVGTLRYMSPEQAAGKPVIDPRSDIYSLGATLYELLTQQPAFPAQNRQECLRQILDEDPPAPHKLNKAVPAELETIVLKAMAKHTEDRYGSAKELADDLRRFLDDQPVRARRPSLQDRIAKWARRHRPIVRAAVFALVAAVVVLGFTAWRIARAEERALDANKKLTLEQTRVAEANRRLEAALKQEAAQRERAEANYREARKVLDFLTRLGVDDLGRKEVANYPLLQGLRRRLLTELKDYYQEFIDQHSDDPTITAELIEARDSLAQIFDEMGEKEKSLAAFAQACRDRAQFKGDHPPQGPSLGGPFGPPRGLFQPLLLAQESVRTDLKMSEDKQEQVKALVAPRGRWPKPEELAAAEKLLTPDQAERLQQIARQLRGGRALLEPEVAKTLKLTEAQKESIHALVDGVKRDKPGRPGSHPPPGRGGRRPDVDWKQINDKALQELTPEQRALWKGMVGETFRGEVRFGPPPPHGH
jgi:serine/threonine protein kinase